MLSVQMIVSLTVLLSTAFTSDPPGMSDVMATAVYSAKEDLGIKRSRPVLPSIKFSNTSDAYLRATAPATVPQSFPSVSYLATGLFPQYTKVLAPVNPWLVKIYASAAIKRLSAGS